MKKNISTEKVTPWVVKPEAVEQSVYEHEKGFSEVPSFTIPDMESLLQRNF
jgi:hypothetical protein